MDKSLLSSENWLEFKSKIELNFPTFFTKLAQRASLRPEKLKLCSLLLIDASTAEISKQLLMSNHAVHLARVSLTRTFDLASSKELVLFLKQLASADTPNISMSLQNERSTAPNTSRQKRGASAHLAELKKQLELSRGISSRLKCNMVEISEIIATVQARRSR